MNWSKFCCTGGRGNTQEEERGDDPLRQGREWSWVTPKGHGSQAGPTLSCCSVAQSCLTLCNPMDCSTPGFPVILYLPEFAQTHVHWIDDAIQPSHPLSSLSPPTSVFPSIRVFSNESACPIRWPNYWSFSFSISPSEEYSGLISFRIDWFDLLAVQGTLKSLLQQHSLKASVIQCIAFFMVQLSHDYWKNQSFDTMDFGSKVMSLLFNMLSRFDIAFLPWNKHVPLFQASTLSGALQNSKNMAGRESYPFI